jgi:hypothetical protein
LSHFSFLLLLHYGTTYIELELGYKKKSRNNKRRENMESLRAFIFICLPLYWLPSRNQKKRFPFHLARRKES